MAAYSLNLRVFWPLVTCGCTALFCLLRSKAGAAAATWDCGVSSLPLLKGSLLLCLLAYLALRGRDWLRARRQRAGGRAKRGGAEEARRATGGAWGSPPARRQQRRRSWLERFYEQQLRLSPHVLGHSKAHVSLVVGEVVRAGKARGRLALRGDFVQVGSAYEQHKVRLSPDAFDVLVPLRLPPRLQLRVEPRPSSPGLRKGGAFACALRVLAAAGEERAGDGPPLSEALCVELAPGAGRQLSSALVLRWFQGHVQRSLGAVRCRLQERCRVRLAVGPGRPLALHLAPCSDYVCCHLSLAVRLIPAIPLGEALFLTAPPPPTPAGSACWTLNVSKPEQRLLGWLREQAPPDSCHLKCLQLLKGLRELGARRAPASLGAHWGRVLSSGALKTALFWLLLRGPLHAWADEFLVRRLEDLVLFLVDGLQRRRLLHAFFGNAAGLPEAVGLPKILKEAAPVNLLAAFDGPTLDLVAAHLLSTWRQAPSIIRTCGGGGHSCRGPDPV
ncbi:inositol 1,4,5-trisphosphate receptor-interacting protein-like 2 [Hemicordylus capensis]|uniref:inositol 1,4,5-trisphosphate receptor-interacting protein-like 2 n=1 Tax=Hemicordylus capensis TaxID=884348 RepID=UPI00230489DF|nr:inositol 1,4,5-trisphosphate receptor-interacting protein-like 2 [Hemicordylus capensis]